MPNLTNLDILGDFVPSVFFDKITLESSGLPAVEDDPHTETEREKKSKAQFANALENRTLSVEVNLNLRDTLSNDLLTSFLDDEDIAKYFSVKVIQLADSKELLDDFIKGSTNLTDITENVSKLPGVTVRKIRLGKPAKFPRGNRFPTSTLQRIREIENLDKTINQDGSLVYDIPLKTRFVVNNVEPESLAYLAYPTFDIESLNNDIPGLSLTEEDALSLLQSRLITEIVIDDSEVVSTSFVFKTEDGEVWDGKFFERDGDFFTGSPTEDIDNEPLEIVEVPNSKVQDFRDIDRIKRRISDSAFLDRIIDNFTRITNEDYFSKNRVNKNYFTGLCVSRSKTGEVSFLFGFNLKSFLKDNAVFPFIYKAVEERDMATLLKDAKILSMKVFRRRIKEGVISSMRLSSEYGNRVVFDKEEAVELIAHGGMDTSGRFRALDGQIKFVNIFNENPDIIHFEGKDEGFVNQTYGLFQYYVEIEVEEPSAKYLGDNIFDLQTAAKSIEDYLTLVESPGSYDYNTEKFTQEFYEIYNEMHAKKVESAVANLVATLKLLDKEFFSDGVSVQLPFGKNINIINRNIDVYKLYKLVEPSSATVTSIHQFNALVQEILAKLSNITQTTLGGGTIATNAASTSTTATKTKVGSGTRAPKLLFTTKYFNEVADAQYPKATGFDYLALAKSLFNTGLKTFAFADFEERASQETLKYFKKEDADIDLASNYKVYTANDSLDNTKLAYFAPATIELDGERKLTTISRNRRNPMDYNRAMSQVKAYNKGVSLKRSAVASGRGSQKEEDASAAFLNLVSNLNIIPTNLVIAQSSGTVPAIDYSTLFDALNAGTRLVVDPCLEEQAEEVTKDNINFMAGLSNIMSQTENKRRNNLAAYKIFSIQEEENALDKAGTTTVATNDAESKPESYFYNLPNQFKSLFLSSAGKNEDLVEDLVNPEQETKEIQDPMLAANFDLNYQNLVKIEALTSYTKNPDEETHAKSSNWTALTYDAKNMAENKKFSKILCRLTPAEFPDFGITQNEEIKLPIFDSYFVLQLSQEEEDEDFISFNYDTSGLDFKTEAEQMLEGIRKANEEIPRNQTFTVVAKRA